MNYNLLNAFSSLDSAIILIAIALGVLIFAAMMFAVITKIVVAYKYRKYNKVFCKKTESSEQLTKDNLSLLNLGHVEVKKVGFLRGLLGLNMQGYGNSYSAYKKAIYLRKNIIDKNSITGYAVSTQKVAHAEFDSKKEHQGYYKIKPFMLFAPSIFIPLMILGVIFDFIFFQNIGLLTIITSVLSFVIFVTFFVILLITIPIEKKANKRGEEILVQNNSITEEELVLIKKVNNAYILSYIADFIYSMLQIIWDIFKIVTSIANKQGNR